MKKTWIAAFAALLTIGLVAQANAQCCGSKAPAKQAKASCCDKGTTKSSCCDKSGAKAACCSKDGDKKAACCDKAAAGQCRGKALAESGMPLLKYKVGDQTTSCPEQAREIAAKDVNAKTIYLVGDTEYTDKGAALQAYETVINDYLASATSVRYVVGKECLSCPMHARSLASRNHEQVQYRVASYNFKDQADADRAAEAASKAANGVTWKMVVDGQEYNCDKACFRACGDKSKCDPAKCDQSKCDKSKCDPAKCDKSKCGESCCPKGAKIASSKETCPATGKTAGSDQDAAPAKQVVEGQECQYVVGDLKTCCETTAKVALAQARTQAALDALKNLVGTDVAGR